MKKNPVVTFGLVAFLLLILCAPANAIIIADMTISSGVSWGPYNGSPTVGSSAIFSFTMESSVQILGGSVSPSDTFPTVFSFNSSDLGFEEAIDLLTNGVDNWIGVENDYGSSLGGSGSLVYESDAFSGDLGFSDPDLAGNTIDSITLVITQFENYVAPEPGENYSLFHNDFEAQIIIEGTPVPEPATMLLLGTGLVGLAGFGRKKFFKK